MLHSMRCNPVTAQTMALDMFDGMLRRSFGDFTGLHLTAAQWQQASLGLAHGGLGLRSTSQHAAAAFLASWASTMTFAAELDATFSLDEAKACPDVLAALAAFNAQLPASQAISLDTALGHKQKALSQMIDLAAWETQLAHSAITGRATLLSEASVGGRAFLNAVPSGRTQMEPAAFLSELRVRLQVPDAASDTWCPLLCDAVLDHNSHHAGMCVAGGERTQRHHAESDLVHTWCQRAGLRPEREKLGLLLPTGPEDMNNSQARRPADVYLPAFAGSPTAFDFAITAPQRQETLAQASVRTAAAAEAYARHKELHLHTAQACEQQGVKFVPLLAECTGTWDPSALKVLKHVAHAAAAKTGEEPAVCYNQLLQELGTTIRSFRARAALRRPSKLLERGTFIGTTVGTLPGPSASCPFLGLLSFAVFPIRLLLLLRP